MPCTKYHSVHTAGGVASPDTPAGFYLGILFGGGGGTETFFINCKVHKLT